MLFKTLAIAIAAVVIALVAYWPAIDGEFIWDDQLWLWNSPTTIGNLADCWSGQKGSDYWPVTASAFWIQYRLWDTDQRRDEPGAGTGYHVVNILLHAASAMGLWLVLKKLAIPGTLAAAAIFLVHPVAVPSVAWITELKNVLSMFLMMLTLLAWLRFDDKKHIGWYLAAIACFALTLLAKTSVVMLPFVLLGIAWWRRNRITAGDILRTAPMFAISAVMGALTIWFQHTRSIGAAAQAGIPEQFPDRLAIAGKTLWFYLCNTLWPFELNMVYERWTPGSVSMLYALAAAAVLIVIVGAVIRGRQWARPLLMGLGCAFIMLLPVLGFIGMSFMKFSFVADHLQYVALPVLIALVVGLIAYALRKAPVVIAPIVALCIVTGLGILTYQRAGLFANPGVLWGDTIARNPSAWVAHSNMGTHWRDQGEIFFESGRYPQATASFNESVRYFTDAIKHNPNWPDNWKYRGGAYWYQGMIAQHAKPDGTVYYDKAIADLDQAIGLNPDDAEAHNVRGAARYQKNQYRKAITDLEQALRLDPDSAAAANNLVPSYINYGQELAKTGRLDESIEYFNKALQLESANTLALQSREIVMQLINANRPPVTTNPSAMENIIR